MSSRPITEGEKWTGDNLMLDVRPYTNPGERTTTPEIQVGEDAGEYKVVGAIVMDRDASGKVEVKEHGDKRVGRGAAVGASAGLVVGLFAPPLLVATGSAPGSAP